MEEIYELKGIIGDDDPWERIEECLCITSEISVVIDKAKQLIKEGWGWEDFWFIGYRLDSKTKIFEPFCTGKIIYEEQIFGEPRVRCEITSYKKEGEK